MSCRDHEDGLLNKEDIASLRINFGTYLIFSRRVSNHNGMILFEMHYKPTLKNLIVSRRPRLIFVLDARTWIWMRVLGLMVPYICVVLLGVHDEIHTAAISMTLCELATARHYSVPLECAPYKVDDGHTRGPISSRAQGECVEYVSAFALCCIPDTQGDDLSALARSAQFWSSYSGYLREVRA